MPVYHQGRKVKEVYHQGRKVKELWYMGRKIYTSFTPRVFTVRLDPGGLFSSPSWDTGSVTGDNTLVQSITGSGLYLAANATYTRTDGKTTGLRTSEGRAFNASEPLPAGVQLVGDAGTYVITEVQNKPVEVMPPVPGKFDARDWLRNTAQKYGQDYATVTELPFEIDSRNATNTHVMFYGCSSLTTVPTMDTSQVTNMASMFSDCSSLTSVPDMNTSQVTDMRWMFYDCSSLTDGNARLIGKHPNVNTTDMIKGSGLTREPFYNSAGQPI